jgi:hypothetical protein
VPSVWKVALTLSSFGGDRDRHALALLDLEQCLFDSLFTWY